MEIIKQQQQYKKKEEKKQFNVSKTMSIIGKYGCGQEDDN